MPKIVIPALEILAQSNMDIAIFGGDNASITSIKLEDLFVVGPGQITTNLRYKPNEENSLYKVKQILEKGEKVNFVLTDGFVRYTYELHLTFQSIKRRRPDIGKFPGIPKSIYDRRRHELENSFRKSTGKWTSDEPK